MFHGAAHCILTKGPPVFSRARRLSPEKVKAVKKEFRNLVAHDHILIASIEHASHYKDLEQVFQRLNEKCLVLNIEKCILGADKLPFLGCEVSKDGISPLKEKGEGLVNYPQPQDVSALRRFLAMNNFYRRFIPNASEMQRILYDLVKGKKKRDKKLPMSGVKLLLKLFRPAKLDCSSCSFGSSKF
ncbi:hypothetical protein AVEN_257773-1 [Araneus ventricosus]|uniref:Uncharacterized protein n=1 Tax=Araneus ventricosus TaxID=182803 RepID=A0A4Y2KBL2_ARAVE|nr:hypothetical protein AVEN_257773-1 [Araneus ventricosus]